MAATMDEGWEKWTEFQSGVLRLGPVWLENYIVVRNFVIKLY